MCVALSEPLAVVEHHQLTVMPPANTAENNRLSYSLPKGRHQVQSGS